uniref:T-box domain-containing protein n=1 Tax=Amphiprion percula TaxID=161767 RepID=A0A3P8TH85_AMPPE
MEGSLVTEDELGSFSIPSSAPSFPATVRPNFSSDAEIESKAVSVASNDCSSALSSPTEASPAKPAATSTSESSPATSCIASASDSLTCSGTSLASESWVSSVPSTTFGTADLENDLPAVLTFKGISVTLENNSVWKQFYGCGTEMILTKPGRRMFPYCRYRLAGLDPDQQYNLVLSIVPSGQYRYRWSTSKWEIHGPPEHQGQGLIRAFSHHYSPCRGSEWMSSLVSFYKLKLTNNSQDQDGHIILHSMHRYIPRLHVIPVLDGNQPTADKPVVMGPESITFTFPQTEFMAVTTYQNFRITQLKINHNPFAKGFREDGHNPRLQRVSTEAQPVVKTEPQEPENRKNVNYDSCQLCYNKSHDYILTQIIFIYVFIAAQRIPASLLLRRIPSCPTLLAETNHLSPASEATMPSVSSSSSRNEMNPKKNPSPPASPLRPSVA